MRPVFSGMGDFLSGLKAGASYFNDPTLTMKAGRKPRCFSPGSMSVAIRKGSNVPASLTPDISCIHGL
jgi:hypothetical protein